MEGLNKKNAKRFEKRYGHLKISLQVLKDATENFDKKYIIGEGGFGKVYRASLSIFNRDRLPSGDPTRSLTVAIKRYQTNRSGQGTGAFITEILLLSNFNHRNVVSLIGFCTDDKEMILVYEYAFNGSLNGYLTWRGAISRFTWGQRLKICIEVARGMEYLHRGGKDQYKTIHRDIKSPNILLDQNWQAKIADFGLAAYAQPNKELDSSKYNLAGTMGYIDPNYLKTRQLTEQIDVYSFGVLLFEVLSGKPASKRARENLVEVGKSFLLQKKLDKFMDPYLKKTIKETSFLDREANSSSLELFSAITYECLRDEPCERPTMTSIVERLEESLKLQITAVENLKISLEEINIATNNFDNSNIIGRGESARVYRGQLSPSQARTMVAVKRFNHHVEQEVDFLTEISILCDYVHKNIIAVRGFCCEKYEKIMVYEYASHGSLDKYLRNTSNKCSLTWKQSLEICLGAARGLDFIHTCEPLYGAVHGDVKSANILLTHDWEAKISNFALSKRAHKNHSNFLISSGAGTLGYCDPAYMNTGVLTRESDVYSFGVVLFEISGKRLVLDNDRYYGEQVDERKRSNKIVDHNKNEQIEPNSMCTFLAIANRCVKEKPEERPTMGQVVEELTKALEFQKYES